MTRPAFAVMLSIAAVAGACNRAPAPPPEAAAPSDPAAPAPAPPAVATPVAGTRPAVRELHGTIKGNTVWPTAPPDKFNLTLQILLVGDDRFTEGKQIPVRTRLGEPYSAWVPSGSYRLLAQVGPMRLWEKRVTIEPESETVVHLTPAESLVSPNEFPIR